MKKKNAMYRFVFLFTCVLVSVTSHYDCDYPSIEDFSSEEYYSEFDHPFPSLWPLPPPPSYHPHKTTSRPHITEIRTTTTTRPSSVFTPSPNPPPIYAEIPFTTSTERPSEFTPSPNPPPLYAENPFTTSTERPNVFISRPNPPPLYAEIPFTADTESPRVDTPRPTPPPLTSLLAVDSPLITVISRLGEDMNSVQQRQTKELNCLGVLDSLISSQWQEEIDKVSVNDLGIFSTQIKIPKFSDYYSNPESEWIQEEGMALKKLDKCFRNLVSKVAPRMQPDEIQCLNKMYPDYLSKEAKTAKLMDTHIKETSRDQLPFKSIYNYFEMTELLFENKNIDALDAELRAVHEDMLDFYIKTEDDKTKKIFIVEQECEWKNARLLKEVGSEYERYQKFGQLVKSLVNRYITAEILQKWSAGTIVPESRFNLWSKARQTMDQEILDKLSELQTQKKDAQSLCIYAGEFANKFFLDQKAILFDKMKNTSYSFDLKTHEKYAYVVALGNLLAEKKDNRLSHAKVLIDQFKEGHYCLTNFIRMIENHHRYLIASTLTNEVLPYGKTYCQIKEMSAKLVNPRYCKCQGTFCEEFGLATIRAQRYQLILLPNNTYSVVTDSAYRPLSIDELINSANWRIAQQKFNTWWYHHQTVPA